MDKTFIQHTATPRLFRFSIAPLNIGVPQVYIHCKSRVTIKPTVSKSEDYGSDQRSDAGLSFYDVDSTARVYTLDTTSGFRVRVFRLRIS